MRASNEIALNITDITTGSPFSSQAIPASQMLAMSVQALTTGTTPTGTLKLQFSNDPQQPVNGGAAPSNWSDIPSATAAVNAVGLFAIAKTDVCYNWVRVVFTFSSGSGTLVARVNSLAL